jgi:hypothetical protein
MSDQGRNKSTRCAVYLLQAQQKFSGGSWIKGELPEKELFTK